MTGSSLPTYLAAACSPAPPSRRRPGPPSSLPSRRPAPPHLPRGGVRLLPPHLPRGGVRLLPRELHLGSMTGAPPQAPIPIGELHLAVSLCGDLLPDLRLAPSLSALPPLPPSFVAAPTSRSRIHMRTALPVIYTLPPLSGVVGGAWRMRIPGVRRGRARDNSQRAPRSSYRTPT